MKNRILSAALLFAMSNVWAQGAGETMTVEVPDYWDGSQSIHQQDTAGGGSVSARAPKGQSKASYEEALWEQRYPKLPGNPPLSGLIENTLEVYWYKCEHLRNTAPKYKNENGYEIAYVQATCNRLKADPEKGMIIRAKFIKTANGHYAVHHEFVLNGFHKDDGASFSTLPVRAEKADRFKRFLDYFPQLDRNIKICDAASRCQ